MQARFYDPTIGRFLANDPVGFADSGNPAMFNRYAYCYDDPVNCADPDGELGLFGAGVGAIIGGVAGAVVNGGAEYLSQRAAGGEVNFKAVFGKAAVGAGTGAVTGAVWGSGAGALETINALDTATQLPYIEPIED